MMRKSTLNLIVDALALVVLAMLAATGFLIAYKLPPGSGGGEGRFGAVHGAGLAVWGLTRHGWGDIHLVLAFVLAALIAIHLVSHWQWIRTVAKVEGGPVGPVRKAIVIGSAVVALALVALPFALTPTRFGPAGKAVGAVGDAVEQAEAGASNEMLYGGLTIDEVSRRTGLSLPQIAAALGAPKPLQGDEKLGRLLREQGLNMKEGRRRLLQAMPVTPAPTTTQPPR